MRELFESDVISDGTQTMKSSFTNLTAVWEWCNFWWYSNLLSMRMGFLTVWEWCNFWWYSNFRCIKITTALVWEWCNFWWYSNIYPIIYWSTVVWEWCNFWWYSNTNLLCKKAPFSSLKKLSLKFFKKNLLPKRKTYGNIYNCQTHWHWPGGSVG